MSGKQRLWFVGAFLLGVVVTVGSYEVTRVVVNARQALRAASSSIERSPRKKPASSAKKKRVPAPKRSGAKRGKRRGVKKVAPKGPDRGVTPKMLKGHGVKPERQERVVPEQHRRRRAPEVAKRPGTPRIGGSLIPTPIVGIPTLPLAPPDPVSPAEPAVPDSPKVDTGK